MTKQASGHKSRTGTGPATGREGGPDPSSIPERPAVAGSLPVQSGVFPVPKPSPVAIELRINGRTEVLDGMHRILAFLEVAERAVQEGV